MSIWSSFVVNNGQENFVLLCNSNVMVYVCTCKQNPISYNVLFDYIVFFNLWHIICLLPHDGGSELNYHFVFALT
jgi:hypothetical protein